MDRTCCHLHVLCRFLLSSLLCSRLLLFSLVMEDLDKSTPCIERFYLVGLGRKYSEIGNLIELVVNARF